MKRPDPRRSPASAPCPPSPPACVAALAAAARRRRAPAPRPPRPTPTVTRRSATALRPCGGAGLDRDLRADHPDPGDPAVRARARLHRGRGRQRRSPRPGSSSCGPATPSVRAPRPSSSSSACRPRSRADRRAGLPGAGQLGYPSGAARRGRRAVPRHGACAPARPRRRRTPRPASPPTATGAGAGGEGGDEADAGVPGLPELPAADPGLDDLLGASSSARPRRPEPTRPVGRPRPSEPATECQVPAQLAALVELRRLQAFSYTERTARRVTGVSRSAVGDVSLLGGADHDRRASRAKVTSAATARRRPARARPAYGTITIAGQEFAIGPDGFEAAGQQLADPRPARRARPALAAARHHAPCPKPVFERDGKEVQRAWSRACVVEIDTRPLHRSARARSRWRHHRPLPEEAKDLKNALGAAIGPVAARSCSPRQRRRRQGRHGRSRSRSPTWSRTTTRSRRRPPTRRHRRRRRGRRHRRRRRRRPAPRRRRRRATPPTATSPPRRLGVRPARRCSRIPGAADGRRHRRSPRRRQLRPQDGRWSPSAAAAPAPHGLDSGLPDLRKA